MATQLLPLQRARARLRIRQGNPSTAMPATGYVEAGTDFQPLEELAGEAVSGNSYWYRLDADHFVWSGASAPAPAPGAAAGPMNVSYRTDVPGAITVLSDAERDTVFNPITGYTESTPKGAVRLPAGWEDANIVTIPVPTLASIGHSTLRVHKRAAVAFKNVFAKIEAAGLTDCILRCDGTFVPRHKGWDPKRSLSSHSWGIAIDLNARWNGYGNPPAPLGAIGSTRDLIPIFASEGFAWGGYFTPDAYRDGMHFELARRDPLPDT
jgi:hypothetical protein